MINFNSGNLSYDFPNRFSFTELLLTQLIEQIITEYRLQDIRCYEHHYLYTVTSSRTGYPSVWTPLLVCSNFIAYRIFLGMDTIAYIQ